MKKPILKVLPNGVRVLTIAQPGALTATALVLVGTGSVYETKVENGLSHFLEHMMFKGTVRFPTTKSIVESFERIGAISNAFTSSEYTGYYAKGGPQNIPVFLDVLSDIYLHSVFPEKEIDKERGVIIEEINMYEDMPQQKVAEGLIALMYGDQPAGWTIAGPKENIARFTRPDFVEYKQKHYCAENTLVVVSGDIQHSVVYKQAKQLFGLIAPGRMPKKQKVSIKKDGVKLSIMHKSSDQTHIAIGFYGFAYNHKDARTASLLATIIGRGLSSRLTHVLREELGAAYYVGAGNDAHSTYGMFEISAGIDKRRINEILGRTIKILKDLKTTLVSDEELHRVLEYTFGMQRLGLESSDDLAGFYGSQCMLSNDIKTPAEIEKLYRSITAADIRRVARALFIGSNAGIAIVGPYGPEDVNTSVFLTL